MESWPWGGEGRGGRGKFISTLFPKMLILGLDNRKDAAKITMKSFPQRHLVTSDFKTHLQKSTLLAHPGLPDEGSGRSLQDYQLNKEKRRPGEDFPGGRAGTGTWIPDPEPGCGPQSHRDHHVP